jgi:hypothetical protein
MKAGIALSCTIEKRFCQFWRILMPRNPFRLLALGLLIALIVAGTMAQELSTTATEAGFLVDYPEEWNIRFPEDFDSAFYFTDGAMSGIVSMLEADLVGDNPAELLEDVIDDMDRDDASNGDFEEPFEEYRLNNEWEVIRATRVRQTDRRLEYLFMAEVREISVYVRVNFRRGGEDEYLPQINAMIASARREDDEVELETASDNDTGGTDFELEYIGTEGNLLQIGALTAAYVFDDESYQLNYPEAWEINSNPDGSLRFINREGVTVFGTLQVQSTGENSPQSALNNLLASEEGYSEIESFSLNGLSAARAYRDNTRGGTKELAMAALRGDVIALMTVSSNSDDFDALEPVFRAVLYSLRPNGTPLELSLIGSGARRGLNSAYVYGLPSTSSGNTNSPQTAIPLEETYETSNGRYSFNYPEGWVDDFSQGTIVLSNNRRFELVNPDEGEVQMLIFFVDRIENLDIDEFSPVSLVEYVVDLDENPEFWGDVSEFRSLARRGAYADYEPRGDFNMRTYFVEMDAEDLIFVRLDMVTRNDEIEDFEPYALAILETVDFIDER